MNLSPSFVAAAALVTRPPATRRAFLLRRLFWPLCAFLLSIFVALALLGQRRALGALLFKGQGNAPGHGNWRITANYIGSCTVTSQITPPASGNINASIANKVYGVTTGTYDLAMLFNPPPTSDTGGVSTSLHNSTIAATMGGSNMVHLSMTGAKIHYTLLWLPESGDSNFDPCPKNVAIFYRTALSATTYASASISGDSGKGDATLASGSGNAAAHSTATGPNGSDPESGLGGSNFSAQTGAQFQEVKLATQGGGASYDIDISMDLTSSGVSAQSTSIHQGSADGTINVDFCVAGFIMPRSGGTTRPLGGGHQDGSSDPTFTRWLPLAFSPQMSSQPFRYQAGVLPAPWGNITCQYSPALRQEPSTPNPDVDGIALETRPSYNPSPAPAFLAVPPASAPMYSIVDANGERLVFQANFVPDGNIHSTLSNQGGGSYTLSNAGPPGAMKERGNYTYTFTQTSTQNAPLTTRLLSIRDDIGNQQSLSWGANGLTVRDNSSGRSLVFNANANGYFSSVDAPEVGGGIHTHTALTWDTNWHCTAVNVYDGVTNNLLHSDTFGYGGPNGDSITSTQKGVSTASFNYQADQQFPDPFGLFAPRLSSATYGASGDSSSSDDGGSVAGTVSYTYGPLLLGYNNWGISAHTNTSTDARGNVTKTIFQLSNDVYGGLVGLTSTGPSFAGSTGANKVRTTYSPNMDQPQSISVFDQLYYAGISTQAWQASLDLLGNLTSVSDPLGNAWDFGYTADGKYLASILDPTGVSTAFSYGERNNPASRLTTLSDPAAGTTLIDYNTFGQPTLITSPSPAGQAQTSAAYNAATGDLIQVLGPTNDALNITGYDALGDPLGVTVYPDTGNAATSLQPMSSRVVWNAAQQPSSATMANGVQTANAWTNGVLTQVQCLAPAAAGGGLLGQFTFNYDSRGRVYQASDLMGTLGQYKYDKNSNLTRLIDGRGNTTQFRFGSNDEPTGRIWADGVHQSSAAYDVAGRVRQTTDERGIVCNYVYDNAHRLTDIQWPNYAAENVHYGYDNAGRLLTVSDSSGGRTYAYSPNTGQLLSVTTKYSGLPAGSNTFVISYSYYGDGSVSTMVSPLGTTSYQYNLACEPTQLTDPWSNVTKWSYDHIGRPISQTTTAPGMTLATAYTWGVSGQAGDPSTAPAYLRQISQSINGQTVWTDTLTHSYLGLLVGEQGSGVNGRSLSAQYGYDGRGRLNAQQTQYHPNATTLNQSSGSYNYDASGNLNGGANGWVYNSNNQLTSAPPSGDLPGATGLSYDAAGHMLTCNGMTLSYNCWGEVAQILNTPQGTVAYAYDSSGRRIRKTLGTTVLYYLYEGSNLIAEVDGSGNLLGGYVWGALGLLSDHAGGQGGLGFGLLSDGARGLALAGSAASMPGPRSHFAACADFLALMQGNGGSDRFYTFDAQGSTNGLVRGGVIIASPRFSPWGSGNLGDTGGSPFGYKGQHGGYTDHESGLIIIAEQAPYVPAAPTYVAPYSYHDATPYQPMGGNPVGSGAPYDEYAPVEGGPESGVGNASSGQDAINRGGGGPNGFQMWRDFMNHVMHTFPFGDCLMALNGMDMGGCKMDAKGKIGNMFTGLLSGAGAVGHFGGIIAPGAEAATAAAGRSQFGELGSALSQAMRRKAGFADAGIPLILDTNLNRTGLAQELRELGHNVRSVSEIFGQDPGDPVIRQFAEQIGGKVISNDRGRVIGEGFGDRSIFIPRPHSTPHPSAGMIDRLLRGI